MRKSFLYLLVLQFLFVGCTQEEACYSCDERVDAFVKENLKAIQQMDRSEIITYSNEQQRAMYRALSPDRKKEIWKDKFAQINSLDLSSGERELMQKFEEFVNQSDFSSLLTQKGKDYLNSLREEGMQRFNWSQRFVVSAFGYLENVDRNGIVTQGTNTAENAFDPGTPKCDCDWGFGCLDGPCDKRKDACDVTLDNCGWFFREPCVGLCRPDLG
ncbi:bacteriocin fulvocin C-related protein [Kordia jejudonensis]|uniref:bacteriocin fulvocin C-related protein n=1 Tax=Kordia jejudonensis TaxID=1348245 RepID=UPI000629AA26|nr:bacteriocin fulvocin C-related protein [Kordia jejudonensis]